MKKLLFVFNPFAGKGQIKNELFNIVDIFTKADYDVTVYPTQAAGDGGRKLREEAANYDMVVASGGDGTLSDRPGKEGAPGLYPRRLHQRCGHVPGTAPQPR